MNCYVCNKLIHAAEIVCHACLQDEIAVGLGCSLPEPPGDPLDTGDATVSSAPGDRS